MIKVNRLTELSKFLEIMIPYARGKKAQAEAVKEFVDSRIERTGCKYNARWNEKERELVERLYILNRFGRRDKQGVNDCTASALGHDHA